MKMDYMQINLMLIIFQISIKIINDNEEIIINLDELEIKLNNKLLTDITYGTITETDSNKIIATKNYVDTQIIHSNVGKYYDDSVFGEIFNDYNNNIASGDYSHAEGYNTTASGNYTYAGGYNTISNVNNMFSIGKFNNNTNNDNKLFVVGNGTSDSDRNDAFVVYDNGNVYCDNNLKIKSLTLNDKIINDIINESEESDDKILATKYYVDNHGGSGGSGVGQKTNNNGGERFNDYVNNTAEGFKTKASGLYSHVEGYQNTSSGYSSHSEGNITISSGKNSHSEGENTKAIGKSSHSEGVETYAYCNTCHTEGWQAYTYAHNTHVGGEFNIADNKNETVIGMCNAYNPNYVKFRHADRNNKNGIYL